MECTRAAIVDYRVTTSPLDVAPPDVPEEATIWVTVAAHIVRRLLTVQAEGARWQDTVAAPLLQAPHLSALVTKRTIAPDQRLWRAWRERIRRREGIVEEWRSLVGQLGSSVPRRKLAAVVESRLPADDRRLMRFGQQLDAVFALPTDATTLAACREAIEAVSRWIDAAATGEIAEEFYRLSTHVTEDGSVLTNELRELYGALPEAVRDEFLVEAARGYCLLEEKCAFLDDALFVFDGQYTADEMRMLMGEYLDDLRARMERAAMARDSDRDEVDAERPGDIPERVRALVWRRDRGRCSVCWGTTELEFDHVIPRSLGGASTAKNVQVLCVRCNEKKGAQVARMVGLRRGRVAEDTRSLFDGAEDAPAQPPPDGK